MTKHVEVRPGQTAVAPKVDDPRAFAVKNESGGPLVVSFSYDATAHVMTVVVEERRPARRLPGQADVGVAGASASNLPV